VKSLARPLQIDLFGPVRLTVGEEPLALRIPAGTISLLAYVLIHHGVPLAREAVAFALCPDADERAARARLRWHLHKLLQSGLPAVGEPWIVSDKRTLQWNAEAPATVDVIAFDRFSADPAEFANAVALYNGELAAGLQDEWLAQPRERYRERQIEMLLALMTAAQENGDRSVAAAFAKQVLRWDPWREDALRAFVRLRYQSGDRAGAIQTYHEFAERLRLDLGVEPMPETRAEYDLISTASHPPDVTGAPLAAPTTRAFSVVRPLPAPLSSFCGREEEVTTIRSLLEQRRLVTLTGSGGVGKTRLAVETARVLGEAFPEGIALVEFASLTTDDMVVPWTARALAVTELAGVPLLETVAAHIGTTRVLLVLDNCEQVLGGVVAAVEMLHAACPALHVLATSREPLWIAGERVELVQPLAARDASSPAVQLFVDRATDAAPAFRRRAGEDDLRLIAHICERLDGVPLAIELAAARVNALSLRQIADRLDDRFALLRGGNRTASARQRTMEATIGWSYHLLGEEERRLFARLGIFPGTFSLATSAAICGDGADESAVLEQLSSLINKSLLNVEVGEAATRYVLLDTIRAYARARLVEAGELHGLRRTHAEYFTALAQAIELRVHEVGLDAFGDFQPELDNVRAALEWSLGERHDILLGARLAATLRWFLEATIASRGTAWVELALALLPPGTSPDIEARLRAVAPEGLPVSSPTRR
jgi:predicted ATPase/DNA-binding SARP family transcriptional activator